MLRPETRSLINTNTQTTQCHSESCINLDSIISNGSRIERVGSSRSCETKKRTSETTFTCQPLRARMEAQEQPSIACPRLQKTWKRYPGRDWQSTDRWRISCGGFEVKDSYKGGGYWYEFWKSTLAQLSVHLGQKLHSKRKKKGSGTVGYRSSRFNCFVNVHGSLVASIDEKLTVNKHQHPPRTPEGNPERKKDSSLESIGTNTNNQ